MKDTLYVLAAIIELAGLGYGMLDLYRKQHALRQVGATQRATWSSIESSPYVSNQAQLRAFWTLILGSVVGLLANLWC